jgi:hypothetical protein
MPFKKLGADRYEGPSGKIFNAAQVRLYYSQGGKFPGEKADNSAGSKNPVALRDALTPHLSPSMPHLDRPRMPHVGVKQVKLRKIAL